MGGRITDEKGNFLFEFNDGEPVAHFLLSLIMKAKFGEKYDPMTMFADGWLSDLLSACAEKSTVASEPPPQSAPVHFIDDGMTHSDWNLRDFFLEATDAVVKQAPQSNWGEKTSEQRARFIRNAIAPHEISDIRLADMIQDIDSQLESYASAFNPEYR